MASIAEWIQRIKTAIYGEEVRGAIWQSLQAMNDELTSADVTQIPKNKQDIAGLKTDVTTVQGDVTTLKSDVSTVKTDMTQAKSDVTTLKTDVTNLKASDTELKDIRVGVDGTQHETAGKAVRTQINDLKADLTSRLNFLALEQGTFNISSGNPSANNNYVRTISKIEHPAHIETGDADVIIPGVFTYNSADDTFVSYSALTNANSVDVSPEVGTYVKLTFKRKTNAALTPYDIQPDLAITKLVQKSYDTDSNTLALMRTSDITDLFIKGGYINTGSSVGTLIDITPVSNSSYAYIIKPCRYGDKFALTGTGAVAGRLWCFVDQNYRSKSVSGSSATGSDLELIAPTNGYLIANVGIASGYSLKVTQRISADGILEEIHKNYTHVTDPHLLAWKMGVFSAAGEQTYSNGMLPNDRFYTVVKLKAGSTITRKAQYTRTKNLSYGYKLDENDTAISGYLSSATNITVEQDCIAYIGIRYSSPVEPLKNQAILDEFNFNLDVIDYESVFDRGENTARSYGYPCPEIYYEGQHIDETGWTNDFSDVSAIHSAFDTLAANSGGFFAKIRDYGVVYTGNAGNTQYSESSEWHIYEYATKPRFATQGVYPVPKVAVICCMHANEKMSVYAMHYLIKDLIENSTKNPVLSYLRTNAVIAFIPVANPYGFMKEIPSRLNENGVNLNRNFPTYNWDEWEDTRTDGNGSEPGGLNYKGSSAGSETETQAMMSFLRNNYDAVLQIDLHTNGSDTVSRDMISASMITMPENNDDVNYNIQHNYLVPAYTFTYRLKPWLNETYNAGLNSDLFYGSVVTMLQYPCAAHYTRETIGAVGMTYEVMAGSSNGLLGTRLTPYSADSIKAAAEELGNYIMIMLAHCMKANNN